LSIRPPRLVALPVIAALAFMGVALMAPSGAAAADATPPQLTVDGQAFRIQSLQGDSKWASQVGATVTAELPALVALTGLSVPGETIAVVEATYNAADRGISYDPATRTLNLPAAATADEIAHGLAHVWFNSTLFSDTWVNEGLAAYAEKVAGDGNYPTCGAMPAYPGADSPNLTTWQSLDADSTIADQNVSYWQYETSCSFFTTVAEAMGPVNFRNVLQAAASGSAAYGDGAAQRDAAQGGARATAVPVSASRLLDLIDERGLIPAGVKDLDLAQNLLAGKGVFDSTGLAARSSARAAFHAEAARKWQLPPAIDAAMESWDFDPAQTDMETASKVLDLRDQVAGTLTNFTLDGTSIQTDFEAAPTTQDLDNVEELTGRVVAAADKLANARQTRDRGRNVLESVGLIGSYLDTPLTRSQEELRKIQPGPAGEDAQSVIDEVDGAAVVGILRLLVAIGVLGLIALVCIWVVVLRRRRKAAPKVESPAEAEAPTPAASEAAEAPTAATAPDEPGAPVAETPKPPKARAPRAPTKPATRVPKPAKPATEPSGPDVADLRPATRSRRQPPTPQE